LNILAVIQCTAEDVHSSNPMTCISPLKKAGFEIEQAFGANRRNYVNVKNARDSFLYVCKISKN